jgi:hypothetical protein
MLATIVDFSALWKVLLIVLAVGVGLTAMFGQGIVSFERLGEARRAHDTGAVVLNGLVVAVVALVCVAALVVGCIAMTHK